MERVIDCPCCFDTDKCFEDIQEEFSSYLCFACGYMSDSRYKIGSVNLIENLKTSPQLVQDLQYHDKARGIVWFPCVINMGEMGIIFPEGTKKDYKWKYAKLVDIPEEQRDIYEGHTKRLDVENANTYDKDNFLQACKDMGITERIS
tara:strand:+ start:2076 stop:2516 length:441 start_codon:yes stop_codon:yes gene_type:complete